MQGIRGAITVEHDTRDEIICAVKELLTAILNENNISTEDIGAVLYLVQLKILLQFFLLLLLVNYLIGI